MSEKYFIGIDSGTSVMKSVVISLEGKELGLHSIVIPNDAEDPVTCYSQDMRQIWEFAKVCIVESIKKAKIDSRNIIGIGITGQGAGTWMIDEAGEPTYSGICWCDGRSVGLAERMHAEGIAEEVYKVTGNTVYSGSQGVQLRWLKENKPEILEKTKTIFHVKDWLFFKLTGIISSEMTDESLPFLNMSERHFEPKSFDLHGISECIDKKPPVLEPEENKGHILKELADEFGLKDDIIVTGGPMDCVACPLGVGTIEPGQVCSTIGTAGIHVLTMDKADIRPMMVAGSLTHAPRDRWIRLMDAISATPSIEWFINNFADEDKEKAKQSGMSLYAFMDQLISNVPIGCKGLTFHPYLAPAGERAPFVNGNAKGSFFGISYQHTRAHFLRAVYEGVAFAALDCYKHFPIPIKEIRMAGGGSNSSVWCQMFADMAGIPVRVPEGTEFGAKGAVIVTGVALGVYKDYTDAVEKTVKMNRFYEPDMEKHKLYEQYYEVYLALRKSFQSAWNERAKLLAEIK